MEELKQYVGLLIKAAFTRKRNWILWGMWILILWLLVSLRIPESNQCQVGIWYPDTRDATQIAELLQNEEDSLLFVRYEQKEDLEKAVLEGQLDCGFIMQKDLDDRIQAENLRQSILYLYTPFTTKGEIAKEYVYAAYMKVYDPVFLQTQVEGMLQSSEDAEKVNAYLASRSLEYRNSDVLFDMELYEMNGSVQEGSKPKKDVMVGIMGILLFAFLGMQMFGEERAGYRLYFQMIPGRARLSFGIADYLAQVLVPLVILLVFVFGVRGEQAWYLLLLRVIVMIGLMGCYLELVWTQGWKEDTKRVIILVADAIMLLINPIIVDLAVWIPIVSWIRYLTPIWYVMN